MATNSMRGYPPPGEDPPLIRMAPDDPHTSMFVPAEAERRNRRVLADALGCDPDLVDDIMAVWAKR